MQSREPSDHTAEIYVSYSSDDRDVVERLVRRLESAGFRIRWDRQLLPGEDWEAGPKVALDSSSQILLCIGRGGMRSSYQREEYNFARAMDKKLIPIRLPGFSGFEDLPAALKRTQFLDYETEGDDAFKSLVSVLGGDSSTLADEPDPDHEFALVFFSEDARSAKELSEALADAGHPSLSLDAGNEGFQERWDGLGESVTHVVIMLNAKRANTAAAGTVLDHGVLAVILMDPRPRPRDYPMLAGKAVPQLIWDRYFPQALADLLVDPDHLALEGAPRCPYVGLDPHSSMDPVFFGREKEIEALKRRLSSSPRLLILAGPAGCGKTSLVSAGLFTDYSRNAPLPGGAGYSSWTGLTIEADPVEELRQWKRQELEHDLTRSSEDGQWIVDKKALDANQEELPLASAVRRVHGDKLLFLTVDQFERVFETDPESAQTFIDELMDAVENENAGVHLLLIVRSEFLDQCRSHHRLGSYLDDSLLTIDPMDRESLRAAIEGPAGEFALTLEEGLTERILDDVQSIDSPVAALSATMKSLWEQRVDQHLAMEAYESLGGAEAIHKRMQAEKIEPSAPLPGRILAGYQADSIGTEDKLNIGPIVDAFCSVMLSKKVDPPLSIGLFGDWGSGKSFFMEEMWRQIDTLTREAREHGSPFWHGHVAQIRFNAWHYSDANLWAAFVTHIFEELAKSINPGIGLQETRARLLAALDTSRALKDEAQFELQEPEYRVALTLLALNIGETNLSDHLFRELDRHGDDESWTAVLNLFFPVKTEKKWENTPCGKLTPEEAGLWQRIIDLLKTLSQRYTMPADLRLYRKWSQNVGRFSFWPKEDTSPALTAEPSANGHRRVNQPPSQGTA